MTDFRDRAGRYHRAIRDVLLHEWDPICVSDEPEARDEYDAYVPGVYRMLISRAHEDEVFDYLWEIETEHMGLYGDRRRTRYIARKLVGLTRAIEAGDKP